MSWRSERFNDAMPSLDRMLKDMDAAKAPILSDNGTGAARIVAVCDRSPGDEEKNEREYLSTYNRRIAAARMRLVRRGLGYTVPTLMCIIRNGRRYGDSVLEIAICRQIGYGAAKKLYFEHRKKIEESYFGQ